MSFPLIVLNLCCFTSSWLNPEKRVFFFFSVHEAIIALFNCGLEFMKFFVLKN